MKKTATAIAALALLISSSLMAGGGPPPLTEDEMWEDFQNPLGRFRADVPLSDRNIFRLTSSLLEQQDFNQREYRRQWDRETSFHDALQPLIEASGRAVTLLDEPAQSNLDGNGPLVVAYANGLPLAEPGWRMCNNDGAVRGAVELAEAWLQDEQMSDLAVRNALYYRLNIAADCQDRMTHTLSAEEINSIPAPWRHYMDALDLFYRDDREAAGDAFAALIDSRQPLVAELSSYMAGRSYLRAAQTDWRAFWAVDDTIDHDLLATAGKHFQLHIEREGRYASSAVGLLRRNAHLAGDLDSYQAELRQALDALLAEQPDDQTATRLLLLLQEAGRHDSAVPLLDHLHQRAEDIAPDDRPAVMDQVLAFRSGVQAFAAEDWLAAYEQLKATGLDPAYPYLVEATRQLDDSERLRAVHEHFLDGNTQILNLAAMDYPAAGPAAFIDTDSAELARRSALAHCSVDDLQTLVEVHAQHQYMPEMRDVLYQVLLQRHEFATLHELMSSDDLGHGIYEDLGPTISQLAAGEPSATAYIHLGNHVANDMQLPWHSRAYSELADVDPERYCTSGLVSHYLGAQYFYQEALNQFGADDHSDEEAQALSLMINCDRSGSRGCWGSRPEDAEPAATLFRRLHRKYPHSEWADRTPYYY